MKKLAILVSVALLLSPISSLSNYSNLIQTVSAAEETVTTSADYWDGTTDTSWYDSEQAEFHLTTAEELAGMYVLVNSGKTMENQTIYLDNNIYLNDISNFDNWSESAPEYTWTPIGTNDIVYFAGTFDGSNHTINGLYRNKENETLTNLGLFGYNKGVIKNVMISSSFIKYEDTVDKSTDDSSCDFLINIGGVCGTNYNLISNCTFNGYSTAYSVVDSDNTSCESKTIVGGICGDNSGGSISKCYNSGKVFSKSEVDSSCSSGYEPVESYATSYSYAGGICGVSDGGTIECSINNGSIDAISSSKSYAHTSYSYSSATSYHASAYCYSYAYAGGICGYGSMVLNECKNNGDINASYSANCEATIGIYRDTRSGTTYVETEANSGGICGYTLGNITNSYNNGNINSNKYSGGIVGYTSSSISNSYNVGTITGETCGGICGYSSSNTTLDKCYYLSGTAVNGVGEGTDNAISKTKANMQTPEFAESLGEAFVYLENDFPQLAFQNELKFAYFTKEKVTLNEYAQSEQLELVTPSYQTPTWISSDTNVATVENGVVTAKNNGSCMIYAVCGEAKAECEVTVDLGYTLNKTTLELMPDEIAELEVLSDNTGKAAEGFDVTWNSSDESVATVENGTVTAVGTGTSVISAEFGDIKLECEVTALSPTEPPTEAPAPELNYTGLELNPGETVELEVNNYSGTINWISDNTTAATVKDGVVQGINKGEAKIYAMLSNGTNLICAVTVNEAPVTTAPVTTIVTTETSIITTGLVTAPVTTTTIDYTNYINHLTYEKVDEDSDGIYDYIEITDCDDSVIEMFIPAEIEGLPVMSIRDYAFCYCINLSSITLSDNITHIGDCAFDSCRILKSISIPNGVTSIGDFTFSYCYKLASITIPDSVTSIGNSAFKCCYSLSNISIGDGVTNIGESAFENCSSLSSIIIPVNVKSIGYEAFYECSGLESIKIENPDCDIYNSKYTIPETATIYGYENSTAQAYAEKYGKWFVSLGEKKPVTTTLPITTAVTTETTITTPEETTVNTTETTSDITTISTKPVTTITTNKTAPATTKSSTAPVTTTKVTTTIPVTTNSSTKTSVTTTEPLPVTSVTSSTTISTTTTSPVTTVVTTTVTTEPETKGDANGDGEINVADIVLIQKCLVRIEVEVDFTVLDINNDGTFNVFDVILLKRIILNT